MGLFHSKVAHYAYEMRNLVFRPKTADAPHLVIEVEEGKLRGKESTAAFSRKKYCSFLWVPFAEPPVGDLRFRPPQPKKPWTGVYDATYERSDCIQKDLFLYVLMGDEDCLYLNIYTPKPPCEIIHPLPVIFNIHGGGFMYGSGSRKLYGADFLINEDVILCCTNYRLHALGFLNLGIEECPGNVGLKDQLCALKWVVKNIRKFGGDPNNVTISGESAGGASVHYMMISPLAQGLFQKAIVQSGSALSSWAITHNPIEMGFRMGRMAGFRGTDRHELVKFLKKFSGKEIVQMMEEVMEVEADEAPTRLNLIAPSIELIAEGAFLPDDPNKLTKLMKPIPTMWGRCSMEGLILFKFYRRDVIDKIGKDFAIFLRDHFNINREILPIKGEEVRQLYFGDDQVTFATSRKLIDFMSDVMFYRFYESIDPLIKSEFPPYVFIFDYRGRFNFITQYMKILNTQLTLFSNLNGACHGDDLFYLFYSKLLLVYPPSEKRDMKMIKTWCSMFANFARTGDPSTSDVKWKPATLKHMRYLHIKDDSEVVEGRPMGERFDDLHKILDPVAEYY